MSTLEIITVLCSLHTAQLMSSLKTDYSINYFKHYQAKYPGTEANELNLIKFIGIRDGRAPTHCDLETTKLLTSIWKTDDIKTTQRCHANVSRSVHRGTAATDTTPGPILTALS